MTKYLQSGRRRDICTILAGEGPLQGQALKTRLARLYDERIDPQSFYGALEALEETGFVTAETAGIHDRFRLTDAGEARLQEHFAWMAAHLSD